MTEFPPVTRTPDPRESSWGWLDVLLVVVVVLAGMIVGCDDGGASRAGTSMGERVYEVTESAWYFRGDLPPIDDEIDDCERLHMLEVLAPETQESYLKLCRRDGWACLHWASLSGRVRSLRYPVAVMNPRLSAARWPAHAIHELLHGFEGCAGLDPASHDLRVFEQGGPTSVESTAERAIYEPTP